MKYKKVTKNPRMGRPKHSNPVQFVAGKNELKAIKALKTFYRCKSRHQLLQRILVLAVCDVAKIPFEESWSDEQKDAYSFCKDKHRGMGWVLGVLKESENGN